MAAGRRAFLAAAALPLLSCAARAGAFAEPTPLEAPEDTRLVPLGALRLDTTSLGIGGLSGLHLGPDLRLSAVSDRGAWLSARLVLRDWRPVDLAEVRVGHLRDGAGAPLRGWVQRDAESLARLPDGTWLVGFERWHRIRAYRPGLNAPGRYVDVPPGLATAPANSGLESLAVLRDGRWLLITEEHVPEGRLELRRAWLGKPGAWVEIAYRPGAGMDPVDATPLPDGGALVLERSFDLLGGFGGRLVRLPPAALAAASAGSILASDDVLLRIEPPLPVDNYEGVAAAGIGGRTLVALVSDDNQNALQQSWLLLFALP